MNAIIEFNSEALSGGATGWFQFDPLKEFGWSIEETIARILGVARDQEESMFEDQDKSVFDAVGWLKKGTLSVSFILCDWREDKQVHVMVNCPKSPKAMGVSQKQFIALLKEVLQKSIPKEFETTYPYSDNVCSWPPAPTKEDAVAMAINALNGFLSIDDWSDESIAPKKVVEDAKAARKALLEAF